MVWVALWGCGRDGVVEWELEDGARKRVSIYVTVLCRYGGVFLDGIWIIENMVLVLTSGWIFVSCG